MAKFKWRKDYGDGYDTDDLVLWINGEPTDNIISPNSGVKFIYIDGEEWGMCDTFKDAKLMAEEKLGLI